jgi:hypothetical protein
MEDTEQQQAQESQEEAESQVQEAAEDTEVAGEGSEGRQDDRQQAAEEGQGPEDDSQESEGEEGDGQEPRTYDQDYVTNLRNEAAGYRVRAQQAETRVQELEAARGTADEQLRNENETLRSENSTLLDRVRRSNFIEAVNLPNARVAWATLADTNLSVEYDENHRPTNLADVRKALKREFPNLFGEGNADGGATGGKKTGFAGRPGVSRIAYAYENEET